MHSIFSLALALLALPIPSTIAAPLEPRAVPIPAVPADPAQPAEGDGIGPYASQKASLGDRADKVKFRGVVAAARTLGLGDAARGLDHYLDDKGTDLNVSPESMMSGLPLFRSAVRALAQNQAAAAWKRISGPASGEAAFSSPWQGFYATKAMSKNWFFAIGGFSYSVTGVVAKPNVKTGGPGTLRYKVHIFDRYNWDNGKSVDIGPVHFEDKDLGKLHLVGLAREYVVRGSSGVNTVGKFRPTTTIPPPSTGGRR